MAGSTASGVTTYCFPTDLVTPMVETDSVTVITTTTVGTPTNAFYVNDTEAVTRRTYLGGTLYTITTTTITSYWVAANATSTLVSVTHDQVILFTNQTEASLHVSAAVSNNLLTAGSIQATFDCRSQFAISVPPRSFWRLKQLLGLP